MIGVIRVRLPTVSDVGETIIEWKLRKAENGDTENVKQKFLQNHFLQDDHKGSLEDAEVRLIEKKQGSEAATREYYWMRILRSLFPDGLHTENDY